MTTFTTAEEVSAEVNRRVALITVANGAETDIGLTVMQGRTKIPADEELPCTQVIELPDEVLQQTERNTRVKVGMRFYLDAFSQCEANNPNLKARAMIRDMKRAIFGDGGTFNNMVYNIDYVGKDIGPRPDGAATVQARLAFDVVWAEDLAKP